MEKECNTCFNIKNINDFPKAGYKDTYRKECKECWNFKNRKGYHIDYKNRYIETRKKYKSLNEDKLKEYYNSWRKDKMENDEMFRMKANIRSLISITFRNKCVTKKSKCFELLGCDYEFFKSYIESQFTKDMNWNNIHFDHIKPLCTAKTKEDVIQLSHYTNFQPLLAMDNFKKSGKLINKQLRLL